MKSETRPFTAQPTQLFKDPTMPLRGCRICGQTLWHDSWCGFMTVGARIDPVTGCWRRWIELTPVLEEHLKEEAHE